MLPAQKIAEEQRLDLIADKKDFDAFELAVQSEILEGVLLSGNPIDIGQHGKPHYYYLADAISEYQDEGLAKILALVTATPMVDSSLIKKLRDNLKETVKRAVTFHAKEILERCHEQ